MNKKTISLILLIAFVITLILTAANVFMQDNYTDEKQNGTLTINNTTVHYEKSGKCLEVLSSDVVPSEEAFASLG